ncbi:N-acetylmuramoyl-L-alanine amidase [Leptolyngbya sp. 'hensonii']|uniref:N-acetylmuramoyl-L-alanine amidase n=1 Tax=Leptolyngbya sp. 'hensonii' TaxID=1922337 RepID=UPI00209BAB1A|nr:N-acetylmuramoyl-L-alanine amidase [Leptolyngbya sp. 'hensonii']
MKTVQAAPSLFVAYPPNNHETTASRIFLIGTAPPQQPVLVNGQPIPRSAAGHFAPSFPLKLGDNLFILSSGSQDLALKVIRQSTAPVLPQGLGFAPDSLMPSVDLARLPGEVLCFSAIAPVNGTVAVRLGSLTLPLKPQAQTVNLPPNSAVLTQQEHPAVTVTPGKYQGCTRMASPGQLGQPEYQLTIEGKTVTQVAAGNVEVLAPEQFEVIEVTAENGVARTGPSTDYSRLTPLPQGTQSTVTAREGTWVRLDYGGWINRKEIRTLPGTAPPISLIRGVRAQAIPGWTEIRFPLQVPVPVSVNQDDRSFTLTLHNTTAQTDTIRLDDGPLIARLDWQQRTPDQLQYTFQLKPRQQWGYKLRYEGTSLVLSLRHGPELRGGGKGPLTGTKILLDPGHGSANDLGARGPTGYPEKDVTLMMAKRLRQQLVNRGATVILTREGDEDLFPQDRVVMIQNLEPTIALSLHYNALPDEGDALKTKGVGTFWYHPQSHSLAVALHNHLTQQLNRPSYGVFWNNLALTRPAVAPSVLLELGFMINPDEFEWIIDPQEQQKLAVALADGIVRWFQDSPAKI